MNRYGVAEDPTALRQVAATFRRDGHDLAAELHSTASLNQSMQYAGPLADRLRAAIEAARVATAQQASVLDEAARRLELAAVAAELEIAARRLAELR